MPLIFSVGNYVEQMGLGGNQSLTEYLRLYIALHGTFCVDSLSKG